MILVCLILKDGTTFFFYKAKIINIFTVPVHKAHLHGVSLPASMRMSQHHKNDTRRKAAPESNMRFIISNSIVMLSNA